MKFSTKIAVLSAILAANLLFFLFFRPYFPQAYELLFRNMPWPDEIEKTFVIIIGFVIASVTSFSIAYMMLKQILRAMQG